MKKIKFTKETITKDVIKPKEETINRPKWVFEIWESKVNPITMYKF